MLDYAVAPHEGKGTGEQALLRQLLSRIYEGDIILGNAHFENYFLLVLLQPAGADVVFEKHGAQPIVFRQCSKRLGKKDGLFVLKQPACPDWLNGRIIEAMLGIMAEPIVEDRPDRIEPRAIKRRAKAYPKLQHSPAKARQLKRYQGKAA